MMRIALSQRVEIIDSYGERRDALDQRWGRFIHALGVVPVPVANVPELAPDLLSGADVSAVILTGGNDLAAYGGDAPERDETERCLIDHALDKGLPLIGVCRGMLMLQHYFGIELERVSGHVATEHEILVGDQTTVVNSYHNFATREVADGFDAWAVSNDGLVEGMRHAELPVLGLMWHPERYDALREEDIKLFRSLLMGGAT